MKLDDILQKPHMISCLPILAGLEGLLLPHADAPKYMKILLTNIMNKHITEEETVINAASKYVINMESKALNKKLFYSMFFEYQGYLSEENTMLLQEQYLYLKVYYRHEIWHIIHYICKILPRHLMLNIQLKKNHLMLERVVNSSEFDWSSVKDLKLHKALAEVFAAH